MKEEWVLALMLGSLGSLHCAVMCGPLVLGMPFRKKRLWLMAVETLFYQGGRTLTYTFMGLLAGLLGSVLSLVIHQKAWNYGIGALFVLIALVHLSGKKLKFIDNSQSAVARPVSLLLAKVLKTRFWSLYAGMLNGLIPCGMVYLALGSAVHSADPLRAATFMFWFGAGTIPLMLTVSLGGIYLKQYFRFNSQKYLPWVMLLMGGLFMLRTAELGLPFVSPKHMHSHSANVAECR